MILVFVGAGGSAAVDPEQYPTTVEFFNRLPDEIKNDPVFIKVREFLEAQKAGQPIDIEEVLWNLDELQDYFQASLDTKAVTGWIIEGNRISHLINNTPDLQYLRDGMRDLTGVRIPNLKNRINAQVYNFYATNPDPEKLSDWVQLLKGLEGIDSAVEIFTTNYDLVLETAIKEAEINVETGRSSDGIQMRLDTACWDHPNALTDEMGRLTKLHGSVDWQRHNEDIIVGNPNFTGNHQNHLILYPGYKGEPDEEPFIKFHEHLKAVVQKTRAAIFIGFTFRDGYINSILSGLRPEITKFVINKDDSLPDLDFLNGCEHSNKGLTEETVADCLQSLRPKVTASDVLRTVEEVNRES